MPCILNLHQMGRATVELDDYLIKRGLEITGLKSKNQVVDLGIRELLRERDTKGIIELEGTLSQQSNLGQLRNR